ncbi:MAG: helix-hairpin-helix domain-containing protein [Bryobacteraceae bacterium]|jgi:hypothetical protein
MKPHSLAVVPICSFLIWGAPQRAATPCEVLVPLLDSRQSVITATAPEGKSYPVFRVATETKLVNGVRNELETSFAQQVLKLDRYARNLLIAKREAAAAPLDEALTAPMYLLMSTEEGGFARFGFWLQDATGKRKLVLAGYVDLVVGENSVDTGDLEEIFSHELGHLILKALTGGLPHGLSRKMHQSMAVTDCPTAFDEGYAEHFQPLVRDATKNAYLHKLTNGTVATDFESFWLSAADGQLRTDGARRNLFIHRKPLPAMALDANPDLYRLFIEDETSTTYLPTGLKNGQEMMASEGVIATLFYRMVNDERLRMSYREPAFYRAFVREPVEAPQQVVTPYENVNLKLFATMEKLRGSTAVRPPIIDLMAEYARLFPDEAKHVYELFIETTWGATASKEVATALQRAAADGHRGDIALFQQDRPFPLLDALIADVASGRRALDANLGPELWVANPGFKIAAAVWDAKRTEPLTINLNTASVAELMTVPGVDLSMARRIIAVRDARGFFRSIDELTEAGVPGGVIESLREMRKAMDQVGRYERQ